MMLPNKGKKMTMKASIGIAVSKGRDQADSRKLATAKRNLARDPSRSRLDDKAVHDRAIDKQLRLAHEAEDKIDTVLNVILDAVESGKLKEDDKKRLITLGDTAAHDRDVYKSRLKAFDAQAESFKKDGGTDPLGWTMTSLSICAEVDSARSEYVQTISESIIDVQSTIEQAEK